MPIDFLRVRCGAPLAAGKVTRCTCAMRTRSLVRVLLVVRAHVTTTTVVCVCVLSASKALA